MRKWKPYGSRTDPGAWLSLANMFPTESGTYRTANAFTTYGTAAAGPASPGTTLCSWFGRTADGTIVGYVGTSTKIYRCTTSELSSGTFTDASAGGGYTITEMSFCQFGNYTIAAVGHTNDIQVRDATGSSAFATLSGSPPKAKICVTQSNCVLLFNLSGAPNAWAASDVGSHTTWDGSGDSVTTTYLLHRAGPITAAVAFRDEVVVFKSSSVYRFRYVGSPVKWLVELIADGVGAARIGSVVNTGSVVIFTGDQGAYIYDGSQIRPIGQGFGGPSNVLEDAGGTVSAPIFYQATNHVLFKSQDNEGWYVYNLTSDAWGKFLPYKSSDGSAMSGFVAVGSDVGALTYPLGIGNGAVVAVNLSSNPCVLNDITESSNTVPATISTTLVGSDDRMTAFKRVTPRFNKTTAWDYTMPTATQLTMTPYTAATPASSETTGTAVTSSTSNLRFDYQNNVRWARFDFALNYACEIEDVAVEAKDGGTD